MAEGLLSFSKVDLFGHRVIDIAIVNPLANPMIVAVAPVGRIPQNAPGGGFRGTPIINGYQVVAGDNVIVWRQFNPELNELYLVGAGANNPWTVVPVAEGIILQALNGNPGYFMRLENGFEFLGAGARNPVASFRQGLNRELEHQLANSLFARIYGFSFEGYYYDLPKPTIFLVHGTGRLVSEDTGFFARARAPSSASLTGIAAADFDFSDGLRVWTYDKADYTIRMDVETGMFEQVLLDAMLGGGLDASGMNARGMNARGMNARGMNARGMNARGMNARGMNARGGGNSD